MIAKIDERRKEYKKFGLDWEKEAEKILSFIKNLNGHILEIGTGKGWFTYKLSQYSDKLITIDIDKETQEIAKEYLKNKNALENIDFIISNAENLPFQDNFFDLCVSVDSLHHFKNPTKVLEEMLRITKINGELAICDFNEKGFEIVDRMHKSENKTHNTNGFFIKNAETFLKKLGLDTNVYESNSHYILIGKKERQ